MLVKFDSVPEFISASEKTENEHARWQHSWAGNISHEAIGALALAGDERYASAAEKLISNLLF